MDVYARLRVAVCWKYGLPALMVRQRVESAPMVRKRVERTCRECAYGAQTCRKCAYGAQGHYGRYDL